MAPAKRKRAPAVEKEVDEGPLIVQVGSTHLSGCANCRENEQLPGASSRPAAKKSKRKKAVDVTWMRPGIWDPIGSDEFVYQSCMEAWRLRFSADGRYMYGFTKENALLIVDLFRSTKKVLECPEDWKDRHAIHFAMLNTQTILALSWRDIGHMHSRVDIHLLRFGPDSSSFSTSFLHSQRTRDGYSYAFVEINGKDVEVKTAYLNHSMDVHFCRLDVDENRLEVLQSTKISRSIFMGNYGAHMSEDGSEFYVLDGDHPEQLRVFSLAQKKWTKTAIKRGGWKCEDAIFNCDYFWSAGVVYGVLPDDSGGEERLFRCTMDEKKWERLPVASQGIKEVSPVFISASGTADGLVTVKENHLSFMFAKGPSRYTIQRHMLRNVDSLKTLAILAARKARDELDGPEGFQQKMSVRPYKVALPSFFTGMEPIPIRCRRCCNKRCD